VEKCVPSSQRASSEIIASRIVDLARSGLIVSAVLRDRVIAEARLSE
jgi:hypothetical protein